MNILIVEDNELQGELLKEMVVTGGHRVTLLDSAEKALIILDDTHFDLIVSDVNLTGMDGFEFSKRVKDQDLKTPFLLYSSREAYQDEIKMAERKGVDKYIEKTGVQGIYQDIINFINEAKAF